MGAPYPILQNGLATTQGIWDIVTTPVVDVGTRAHLNDGRVYYYARNSGSAIIIAGHLTQSELVSADMDDLATNTAAVGDSTVAVTPVGTATFAANDLAGGYLTTNSGTTGAGISYKILSHPVTVQTTAFTVTLVDQIAVVFNADMTATVQKNPWMDTVIAATGAAYFATGVPNFAVPAGNTTAQYYWCQTWGFCAVAHDDTSAAGDCLMSGSTTAGEVQVATAQFQKVGVNFFLAVAGDFNPTFLTIAP